MSTTITQGGLPPAFLSLYRLFLRTASTSVLHHTGATRNLRRLLRPSFDAAAQVTKQLQSDPASDLERKEREEWLRIWERRMDNSLELLYNSSKSRGLTHQLTRNLAFFMRSENRRITTRKYKLWQPNLPFDSPLYKPPPPPTEHQLKKQAKLDRYNDFDANAWSALSEVVQLAEGRDDILLGRVTVRKPWFGAK